MPSLRRHAPRGVLLLVGALFSLSTSCGKNDPGNGNADTGEDPSSDADAGAPDARDTDDGGARDADGDGTTGDPDAAPGECGDGVLQTGEECDGEDFGDLDCSDWLFGHGVLACLDDCTVSTALCNNIPVCGDGIAEDPEECDDGNRDDQDGCAQDCREERCGDGIVQEWLDEECDGGAVSIGCGAGGELTGVADCESDCHLGIVDCPDEAICGDGSLDLGEACDDGNTADGDGCSSDCAAEECGNGALDPGEACDGESVGDASCEDLGFGAGLPACGDCVLDYADCHDVSCGDGRVEGDEECDDGNSASEDGCSRRCVAETCGDGVRQEGLLEQCDTEDVAGVTCADFGFQLGSIACSDTCTFDTGECVPLAACGNGTLDSGEACDDGNAESEDGCSRGCLVEACGDGVVQPGLDEECEPGVRLDATCAELGFFEGSVACDAACTLDTSDCREEPDPVCGNGAIERGETCDGSATGARTCRDEGFQYGRLVCTAGCDAFDPSGCANIPVCGDGLPEGEEQCDDGNMDDGDGCSAACVTELCGDGIVQPGLGEACDLGNVSLVTCTDSPGRPRVVVTCGGDCDWNAPECPLVSTCGDGTVQLGEACDDGNTNDGDGCSSACSSETCGNGALDGGEACDGLLIGTADCTDFGFDDGALACEGCALVLDGCRNAACGDGTLDGDEECDDGNTVPGDACSHRCTLERCGDGTVDAVEACDDGNGDSGDGCSDTCREEFCGDGVTQPALGELCDDGALNSDTAPDACRTACLLPACGDGVADSGEACDDGALNSDTAPDACRTSCAPAGCGDGVEDTGEECDEGEENSDTEPDACRTSCAPAGCGDGVEDTGEECDEGEENSDTEPDACRTDCQVPICGDGVTDSGEGCDTGDLRSDSEPDACRTTCLPAACGDSIIDSGETCDDGPENSDTESDACRTACVPAFCGDDVVDSGETCDDGALNSDTAPDACRTECLPASCGDDVVDSGEQCDTGAARSDSTPDACRIACVAASCGDDVVDSGEQCDTGAARSDTAPDACRTDCRAAWCGDGVSDSGEACDEGALNSDTAPDACRTTCALPRCGDGAVDTGEACDDGNNASGDLCSDVCVVEFAPIASFAADPTSGTVPFVVSFDASASSDPDGTIVSWDWDFGDGTMGAGLSTVHVYTEAGLFEVTLLVTDDIGLTTTATILIDANAGPVAAFTATPMFGAAPLEVDFDASASTDPDGAIASFEWNFGDGEIGTGVTTTHTYAAPGAYNVTLLIADDNGATALFELVIRVNELPIALFTHNPDTGNAPLPVSFDGTVSSDPDGTIARWEWDFGDGSGALGSTTSHTYTSGGTFAVTLTVTDNLGATATGLAIVTVNEPPVARFTTDPEFGAAPLDVTVDASTSSDDDAIVSWDWDFGDASTGSGETASHAFTDPGTYTVTLTVTDSDGVTATFSRRVTVLPTGFDRVWVGGDSVSPTGWSTGNNWSPAGVPTGSESILIPASAPNQPVLGANTTAGTLTMEPGAILSISGYNLTLNGSLYGGNIGGTGTVILAGGGTSFAGDVPALQVNGSTTLVGDSIVDCNMTLGTGATLTMGGRALDVGCNLTVSLGNAAGTGLRMLDPLDLLTVQGNATFFAAYGHSTANSTGSYVAGRFRLRGNFREYEAGYASGNAFVATGTTVLLDGTAAQTVQFDHATSSRFAHLEVSNPAGVTVTGSMRVAGQLTMLPGGVIVQGGGQNTYFDTRMPITNEGYRVTNNRVYGTVTLDRDGELPNGVHLFVDSGTTLVMNGRTFHVTGNFRHEVSNNNATGLRMGAPTDLLDVDGYAYFVTTYGHGAANTSGNFVAGTIRVGGDFTQTEAGYASGNAFVATGTRVILDGLAPQTIAFNDPASNASRFWDVDIENPTGATFGSNVVVTGLLRVLAAGQVIQGSSRNTYFTRRLPVTTTGYRILNSRIQGAITAERDTRFHNSGNLFVDSGYSLRVGGRRIVVDGNLTVTYSNAASDGLYIQGANDRVTVRTHATFTAAYGNGAADSTGDLSGGLLEIGGNFIQTENGYATGNAFIATGTRVVFNGTAQQSVSFNNPARTASRFFDVDIENATGVTLSSNVVVMGRMRMIGDGAISQASNRNTYFNAFLPDTNANFRITNNRTVGSVILDRDVVLPNASNLFVDSGTSLTLSGFSLGVSGNFSNWISNSSGDGLFMTGAADRMDVDGNATFTCAYGNGSGNAINRLTAGEFRLAGNFVQTEDGYGSGAGFRPTGTRFVFDGTALQTVSFNNPGTGGSYFDGVVVENQVETRFTTIVYVRGLLEMAAGGRLNQSSGDTYFTGRLPRPEAGAYAVPRSHVAGALAMTEDAVFLEPGVSWYIDPGASLSVNGHRWALSGNLTVTISNTASDGLVLSDVADVVEVNGNTTFAAAYGNGSASSFGDLTDGELHLRGNFTQTENGYASGFAFISTGTAVVFDGAAGQTVSFNNPATTASRFFDVRISNPAGVTFSSHVSVMGQLEMVGEGRLVQGSTRETQYAAALPRTNPTYQVTNSRVIGRFAMTEDADLPNGCNLALYAGSTLTLDGHSVHVGGDLLAEIGNNAADGIVMTHAADLLDVDGAATFRSAYGNGSANSSGDFTAGEIRIGGNFLQTEAGYASGYGFISTGTLVVFDGTGAQSVSFNNPGSSASRFFGVRIDSSSSTTFATTAWISDTLDSAGTLTVNGARTVDTRSIVLRAGSTLVNNGALRWLGAGGSFTDEGATISGNAPVAR